MTSTASPLLGSFYLAGFEGSTHLRRDGRRLDMVDATQHDRFVDADYRRMLRLGFRAARESLRWHLDEPRRNQFTMEVELPRLEAAARHGVTVVWDLCHFGWPNHVDPFRRDFPVRLARYAAAAARAVAEVVPPPHWFAPVNEISFLTWAGGEVGVMNPFAVRRGRELKRQLVRGALHAMDAIRGELPDARFLHPEPLVNIAADPARPHERANAKNAHDSQFEAMDLLAGLREPALGGAPDYLDVLGANYYPDNQWIAGGGVLADDDPDRTPLRTMLADLHARYGKPLIISETGTEDGARRTWLASVQREVGLAQQDGVPVEGICLYPILNHPGWEDDRHCCNGVWDYAGPRGGRRAHRPLVRLLQQVAM